jgi:hypothetical protein
MKGEAEPRATLFGYHGVAGTPHFKIMARQGDWKYIYFANGGLEQLFNLKEDPNELNQRIGDAPEVAARLRKEAAAACARPNADRALDDSGALRAFEPVDRPLNRIYQFCPSRGVHGFPEEPEDALREYGLI